MKTIPDKLREDFEKEFPKGLKSGNEDGPYDGSEDSTCSCPYYPSCEEEVLEFIASQREEAVREVIFDLFGRLTTRDEPITMSAHHDAAPVADLMKEYLESLKR